MPRGGFRPGAGRPKKSGGKPDNAEKAATKKAAGRRPGKPIGALPAPELVEALDGEFLPANLDPLDYMLQVMNNPAADPDRRDKMAIAAAPYKHGKVGEAGKKAQKAEAARNVGGGRFGARPAPGAQGRPN